VEVFGSKFKKIVGYSIEFLFELTEHFAKLDRQIYEMNNPFRLKDYEVLFSSDYEVLSILENLRKKSGISGDMILMDISLENFIRRIVPPTPKEKVEYVLALREVAAGNFDLSKYLKHQGNLKFVGSESHSINHDLYRSNEVNKNER